MSGWDFARATRLAPGTKITLALARDGNARVAVVELRELLP